RGMHIEHIYLVLAFERGEADRRSLQRRDKRQLPRKLAPEATEVIRNGRPSLLLGFCIVVAGQLLDAVAKDFTQQQRIRRQERTQCELRMRSGHHRATSHVVPSLESLSTTPIAASSSRMRSDSLKFFAFRAASRAKIIVSIVTLSTE